MRPLSGNPRPSPAAGLTLIEVLLAIVIASLVISLVFSMYHAATRTVESQQQRRAGADATAAVVDRAARELACAFGQGDDEKCRFLLASRNAPEGKTAELSFATVLPAPGAEDLRWSSIARIAYRVTTDEHGDRWLTREFQPLAGPGADLPPETNLLVRGVAAFNVMVFDGSEWVAEWPVPDMPICPEAARVELVVNEGSGPRTFQTETMIPTGTTIPSTLERATSEAP